jgi:hypothetical protein
MKYGILEFVQWQVFGKQTHIKRIILSGRQQPGTYFGYNSDSELSGRNITFVNMNVLYLISNHIKYVKVIWQH